MNSIKNHLTVIALLGSVVCACGVSPGSGGSPTSTSAAGDPQPKSHADVAVASLPALRALVASGDPKKRGFQSTDEVAAADLGNPLPMVMIGLDQLKAYRPGSDPRALFMSEDAFLYPVGVAGEVRSSVLVQKRDGVWQTAAFGQANLARASVAARRQIEAVRGGWSSDIALVEIPALSIQMLGHDENGVPMLTPLSDVPGAGLRAGQALPAATVLAKLAPFAVQSDG